MAAAADSSASNYRVYVRNVTYNATKWAPGQSTEYSFKKQIYVYKNI